MTCKLIWAIRDSDAETRLRIRPLREHWEARGPGLFSQLGKQLPWLTVPDQVTVHLIKPRLGGAGRVLSPSELEFEAVLANPWPRLPEVVRLGWLIGQLDTRIAAEVRGAVAMLPAVILAAQYVELATLDQPTLQCGLQHWFKETVDWTDAETLLAWWREVESAMEGVATEAVWQHKIQEL